MLSEKPSPFFFPEPVEDEESRERLLDEEMQRFSDEQAALVFRHSPSLDKFHEIVRWRYVIHNPKSDMDGWTKVVYEEKKVCSLILERAELEVIATFLESKPNCRDAWNILAAFLLDCGRTRYQTLELLKQIWDADRLELWDDLFWGPDAAWAPTLVESHAKFACCLWTCTLLDAAGAFGGKPGRKSKRVLNMYREISSQQLRALADYSWDPQVTTHFEDVQEKKPFRHTEKIPDRWLVYLLDDAFYELGGRSYRLCEGHLDALVKKTWRIRWTDDLKVVGKRNEPQPGAQDEPLPT